MFITLLFGLLLSYICMLLPLILGIWIWVSIVWVVLIAI